MRLPQLLLTLVFVASLGSESDTPAFRPAPGSSVTKKFQLSSAFELSDLSLFVDGEDFGAMMGTLELNVESESVISVRDTYIASSNGRPQQLKRTFEALESASTFSVVAQGQEQEQDIPASSELEGRTVQFTWNEDQGDYDVEFADEGGNEELLECLDEEMDLRSFLPTQAVSAEDSWEIDVKALSCLLMPGGDLSFRPDSEAVDEEMMEMFEEMFTEQFLEQMQDLLRGTCVCTYKGEHEADGVRVGEIHITIEIASAADLSDLIKQVIQTVAEQNGETEIPIDIEAADVNLDLESEGALLWNLEAGRLHSFQMQGDGQIAVDVSVTVEEEGQEHSVELSAELSGSMEQLVETDE